MSKSRDLTARPRVVLDSRYSMKLKLKQKKHIDKI